MITPGKYHTRGGRIAVILCTDAPGLCPVIGYIMNDRANVVSPEAWTHAGVIYATDTASPRDLLARIPETPIAEAAE